MTVCQWLRRPAITRLHTLELLLMVLEETAGPCQLSLKVPEIRARLLEQADLDLHLILIRQRLVILNAIPRLKQLVAKHLSPH
jgi:hypothetical protein